jgi:O-antigen/teichoic acid export membrane protein
LMGQPTRALESLLERELPGGLERLRGSGTASRIVRGAGITFVIQVSGVILAYAAQVLLARWLGTTEYGRYTYAFSWAILLSVPAGLGMNVAVLRYIPQYRTGGEPGLVHGVMQRSRQLVLGVGAVVAALVCGAALVFASPEYAVPLALGIWLTPLIALMNLYTGMSRALRRVTVAFAPPLVLRPLLLICGISALVLFREEIDSSQALLVALATLSVIVLFQGLALRRTVTSRVEAATPEYRSREWLSVSTPLLMSLTFGTLITQVGVLLLGILSGPDEVGIYNAAVKTALFVNFVLVAINALAAPTFASLHAQGRREELQRLLVKLAHVIFWPSLAISAGLVAFSGLVLGMFGEEFLAARTAMAILIVGQLVNAGAGAVGYLTDLTGYQRQGVWVRGWSTLLCVLMSAVLIPFYGIVGAAVATAASMALKNIWLHRLASRNLGVSPSILSALSRMRTPGV